MQIKKWNGVTLLEVMVTVGIFLLVSAAILTLYIKSIQGNDNISDQLSSEAAVRKLIETSFPNDLRPAESSGVGSFVLSKAEDDEINFYSDVDGDSRPELVRYYLDGNTLKRGVISPTGEPPQYLSVNESVKTALTNINNGSIFTYYDNSDSPLGQPVNPGVVKAVGISVTISDPTGNSASFSDQTKIVIRSVEGVNLSTASTTILSVGMPGYVPVTGISLNTNYVAMPVCSPGSSCNTQIFSATVIPADASNQNVIWSIVTGDGSLTPNGSSAVYRAPNMPQVVTIQAKAGEGNFVATASIHVLPNSLRLRSTRTDSSLINPFKVTGSGDYAFVGSISNGNSLTIWNVSNPDNPMTPPAIYQPGGFCDSDTVVSGDYAYVADYCGNSLKVFNVANKNFIAPPIGSLTLNYVSALAIQGQYIYAVSGRFGNFYVVDVSNPANPVLVNSVTDIFACGSYTLSVQGNYAYVISERDPIECSGNDKNAFRVVNISNPANPSLVTEINDAEKLDSMGMVAAGNYAYLPTYNGSGLTFVDISNPANPTILSSGYLNNSKFNYASDIAKYSNYVYVSRLNGIVAVDVSDIANPSIVAEISDASLGSRNLFANSKYIFNIKPDDTSPNSNPGVFNVVSW